VRRPPPAGRRRGTPRAGARMIRRRPPPILPDSSGIDLRWVRGGETVDPFGDPERAQAVFARDDGVLAGARTVDERSAFGLQWLAVVDERPLDDPFVAADPAPRVAQAEARLRRLLAVVLPGRLAVDLDRTGDIIHDNPTLACRDREFADLALSHAARR